MQLSPDAFRKITAPFAKLLHVRLPLSRRSGGDPSILLFNSV
jgi:hypothetical protein